MGTRRLYLLAVVVGSTLGGFVPELWGAGGFSGWGILASTAGGLTGIWLVHRYFA